jgi:hypothetical protein
MALQLNNVQVIYEIIVYQIDQMSDCRFLVASGFISVQYIEYRSSKGAGKGSRIIRVNTFASNFFGMWFYRKIEDFTFV